MICAISLWMCILFNYPLSNYATDLDKITLTIKLDKRQALLAEPIFMKIRFSNLTERQINLPPFIFGIHGNAEIELMKGKRHIYLLPLAGVYALKIRTLSPLGEHEEIVNLGLFNKPDIGRYTVRVIYYPLAPVGGPGAIAPEGWKELKIVSNEEQLEIREPIGEDAQAFKLLTRSVKNYKTLDVYQFYGFNNAEEVVYKYPKSTYSKYCMLYVGLRYAYREPIKAVNFLKRLTQEFLDDALADDAQFYIAKIWFDHRRFEEAKRELMEFFAKFPNSEFIPRAKELDAKLNALLNNSEGQSTQSR